MKLKRTLLFALVGLFISISVCAQEAEFRLMAESHNGLVKLGWLPSSWPENLEGVVIMRSKDQVTWEKITQSPVLPGFDPIKPIDNIESDKAERQRLLEKQKQLLEGGKAKVKTTQFYYDEILPERKNLLMLSFAFGTDYDIMRLNGFGMVDRDAPKKEQLFYALHGVKGGEIDENPIDIVEINNKNASVAELPMNSSIEVTAKKDVIILNWKYSIAKFKESGFKAFNVYQIDNRKEIRLNDNPIIVASTGETANLNRQVAFPKPGRPLIYEARPLTQFDFEMTGTQLVVDPQQLMANAGNPVLKSIVLNEGIMLVWEGLRKGYKIELQRKEGPHDFSKMADLDSEAVSYRDINVEPGHTYIYRMVVHLSNNRPDMHSDEIFVHYKHSIKPAQPVNVDASIITTDDKKAVKLSWGSAGDDIVYRIFIDSPFGELAHDSSIPDLNETGIIIPIDKSRSEVRRFAIQAMDSRRNKSELSKVVEVITPSSVLPPVKIWPIQTVDQDVVLYWDYSNEIADLEGFKIYQNGVLLTETNNIGRSDRNFRVRSLESGNHTFELEAITAYGVTKKSRPVNVVIE